MTTTSSNKSVLSANLVSGRLFSGTAIYPISYNDSENSEYPSRDEQYPTTLKTSNIMQSPEASSPSVREAEGGGKHSENSPTDETNHRVLPPVALNEPSLRPSSSNNNYGSTNALRDGFRGVSVADEEVGFLNNQFPGLNKKYKKYIRKWHVTLQWMVFINCIWLVFTIINDYFFTVHFISPNRVAGFQDVSIIFVSVVSNFLATLMSGVSYYSKVDQFTNISLLSFTGINLFLSLAVTFTRGRIGTTGVGTYVWAALSFALSALRERSLYIVTEENKSRNNLQARAYLEAGRRTVKEWINLGMRNLVKILLMAYMALYTINNFLHTVDLYRTASSINDIPSPKGTDTTEGFFWVDDAHSYRIHIKCYGDVYNNSSSGATSLKPIVLYEHGGLDTGYLSADWIQELYHLNELDRYCIYDRPGYGLSDSPPAPNSMGMIAEGLKHALLKEAGINGPFVTVGYDLGGLQTQIFTAKNSDLVKGMMLIDSWHEDILLNKLTRSYEGDGETEVESSNTIPSIIEKPNSLHLWWKGIVSPISLKLQTSWLFAHHGSRERIYGRDLVYQGTYLRAKFLEGITNSMLSYSDVMNSRDKLSQMLTSVVSSKDMIKQNTLWGNWQRELSKISSRTQEWEVIDGGHELYKYSLGKKKLQEVLLRLVKDS